MTATKIEWTDATWNPLTGCTRLSPGCAHCYAERMARRLQAMGNPNYVNGFELTLHDHVLDYPLRWKRPRMIFVNSMSDLFHKDVPVDFIRKAFAVMERAHWHTFQVLTKRSTRLAEVARELPWPGNVWMGVSVESADYVYRIHNLAKVPARVRFASIEPLLGPIPSLPVQHLDWAVVGGESGPGARPVDPEWVRDLRDQCLAAGKPFFFKQWGGVNKARTGRELDGKTWSQRPPTVGD